MCNHTIFSPPEGMYEFVREIIPGVQIKDGIIIYHDHQVLMDAVQKYHETIREKNVDSNQNQEMQPIEPFCV